MRRLSLSLWIIALVVSVLAVQTALAAPGKDEKKEGPKPVVAVFRLSGSISELPAEDLFSFAKPSGSTLRDLVTRLKKAAKDPEVKAIALMAQGEAAGLAQTEELREAMGLIRAAGKDI